MTFKQLVLLSITVLFLYYCNPKAILTGVTHTSDVDSVLFYQQNPVADPLLDEIQTNPGNSARLSTILYPPPPPPPPDYREIEGFRIQIFAGSDSISAVSMQQKADTEIEGTVYLINEGGLYKLQVGDYPYRMDADNMNQTLKNKGFNGAWVAKRMIRVPLDSITTDSSVVAPKPLPKFRSETTMVDTVSSPPDSIIPIPVNEGRFKIQVVATSDELKARQLELELEEQFSEDAFYEPSGNIYKVFIGRFQTRPEAEKLLKLVRENGYPDAWLVY